LDNISGTVTLSGNTSTGSPYNGLYVNGTVTVDSRFTADPGFPYISTGSPTVNSGKTLTIDPGVVIKCTSSGWALIVNGSVSAVGTVDSPIYFTSLKDDTVGGDTNGDGSATSPAKGNWYGIKLQSGGSGVFEHCVARYGGGGGVANFYGTGGASLTLRHCTTTQSSNDGVYISSGTLIANSTIFAFNSGRGVYLSGGTASLLYCDFWSNLGGNIYATASLTNPIYADPCFVNLAGGDYQLMPSSPCIDTGDPAETDPDGSRSDRGALLPLPSVAFAKTRADGTPVTVVHSTATCGKDVYGTFSYTEDWDRIAGIKIVSSDSVPMGQSIELKGTIRTTDGEREIVASEVRLKGSRTVPGAFAMNNRWLGGANWRYDPATGTGQRGVMNGLGLNNIGLLVRVWGKIVERDSGSPVTWFRIDDGVGVKVKCVVPLGIKVEPSWVFVAVKGISSSEMVGAELHRLIRLRDQADITPY